ncbi:hypothetical protein FGIG_09497 [Fasciola gigantica]|uniref:Uncharacterized protein n=1 Tax=Fasciola gigantica TaxID=46835 RepID=A0A504YRG2_FASGI|nr:hypothetical protein FGIG_09497 [Fasciola gigantica]
MWLSSSDIVCSLPIQQKSLFVSERGRQGTDQCHCSPDKSQRASFPAHHSRYARQSIGDLAHSRNAPACLRTTEIRRPSVPRRVSVSGWISKAIDLEHKQGQLFGPRSSNDLMQEIVNFVQRYNQVVINCDAVRSARSSLLTGFWIMLCLAVIMSVVTSYLIYEQHQQQNEPRAKKSDRRKLPKSLNLLPPLSDDITVREERSVAVGGNPC